MLELRVVRVVTTLFAVGVLLQPRFTNALNTQHPSTATGTSRTAPFRSQQAATFSHFDARRPYVHRPLALHSSSSPNDTHNNNNSNDDDDEEEKVSSREKLRRKARQFANAIGVGNKPMELAKQSPNDNIVRDVLQDAISFVGETASKESMELRNTVAAGNDAMARAMSADASVETAFEKADKALEQAEIALELAHTALREAKAQARAAIDSAEDAAVGEAQRAAFVASEARTGGDTTSSNVFVVESDSNIDVSTLTFDDAGFHLCEDMGEPYLDSEMCLVPGEAIARVEKAPENSRRIFAGIDIMASVDDVWNVLTNYAHLQDVVPNLVVNEVLEFYNGEPPEKIELNPAVEEDKQCKLLSTQMRGSKLRQIGGAKVAGINFSARTTLEVREWPGGLPDFAHFTDEVYQGKTRDERAKENAKMKLTRYKFPRPFALSKLPTKDISMQSIEKDDGEFRMYQGVWRMQPLPGCAPEGKKAMRLTYAVEVSPRPYLPVALVERRIVADLCNNLEAIRDFMAQLDEKKEKEAVAL